MYEEVYRHTLAFPKQRQSYKIQKDSVLSNIEGDECMIVLDFSHLQVQNTFRQDLIICIYRNYGTQGNEQLQILKTYHYVAPHGTSADIKFVIGSI